MHSQTPILVLSSNIRAQQIASYMKIKEQYFMDPLSMQRGNLCPVLCLVAQSCLILCNPMDCSPPGSAIHGDSLGKNTRVGCHALLQVFPTQGRNRSPALQPDSLPSEPPGKPSICPLKFKCETYLAWENTRSLIIKLIVRNTLNVTQMLIQ